MRVLLTSLCLLLVEQALTDSLVEKELSIYQTKIKGVVQSIAIFCPQHNITVQVPKKLPNNLAARKELFQKLLEELLDCQKADADKKLTTTTSATATTHKAPTAVPKECQTAVNYTQPWRQDHNGSNIKGGGRNSYKGYACDFHVTDSHWFRFSGEAGNRMYNMCPERYSCGTAVPFWTDEKMPQVVGVESEVSVYGHYTLCKGITVYVKVMRCSWDTPHDLIYKQTRNFIGSCSFAFCGMP